MSCEFVLNCSEYVDWQLIIASISATRGRIVVPNKDTSDKEYQDLYKIWDAAGLNYSSARWENYYPGDYCKTISSTFETILDVTHIRSWISRIDPGYSAPWHYDIDHDEQEYLKLGKLRRFICFIGDPAPGHISIVNDRSFYNEASGNVYEWNDYRAWHAGANVGLVPKYQYNFLSYS
jgi:hypothetical protein